MGQDVGMNREVWGHATKLVNWPRGNNHKHTAHPSEGDAPQTSSQLTAEKTSLASHTADGHAIRSLEPCAAQMMGVGRPGVLCGCTQHNTVCGLVVIKSNARGSGGGLVLRRQKQGCRVGEVGVTRNNISVYS